MPTPADENSWPSYRNKNHLKQLPLTHCHFVKQVQTRVGFSPLLLISNPPINLYDRPPSIDSSHPHVKTYNLWMSNRNMLNVWMTSFIEWPPYQQKGLWTRDGHHRHYEWPETRPQHRSNQGGPPDDGGPEERGKATPNDHPDGAGIFKLALLNALQDMREDVRKNRQQHQRCLNYIVPASSRTS